MNKNNIRNGVVGGLAALVLALSSGGCATKTENKNSGNQEVSAHLHKSEIYTDLEGSQALKLEQEGWSMYTKPDSVSLDDLKEHIGEYTILQKGFNPEIKTDSYLKKKLGPVIDGEPNKEKLYQALAMARDANSGLDIKVPRLYVNSTDKGFKLLSQYPVYSTEVDALKDIERVVRVLKYQWDDSEKPNISLVPVKITEELISKYANK